MADVQTFAQEFISFYYGAFDKNRAGLANAFVRHTHTFRAHVLTLAP